jgi:hypothetical protein
VVDKAAFEQDELLQGWFVRNLQIVGEAARALPEDVRALAPEIEWPKIIGMRNVLVHGDFEIDTQMSGRRRVGMPSRSSLASSGSCSAWRNSDEAGPRCPQAVAGSPAAGGDDME